MLIRRGRLLPSVIVGALVAGAVTLGAGTASAAPNTCRSSDGVDFVMSGTVSLLTGTVCSLNNLLGSTADELKAAGLETLEAHQAALAEAAAAAEKKARDEADALAAQQEADRVAAEREAERQRQRQLDDQRIAEQRDAAVRAQQDAARRDAAAATQRAAQAQTPGNANLLAPAASAPGGLAATVPALRFGTPNPALLLAPPGSPLRTLAGENTGSPVTTTSDVQAIAFDNMPGGMGTPAVVGVLILSTLGAFALRHRMLRRSRTPGSSER